MATDIHYSSVKKIFYYKYHEKLNCQYENIDILDCIPLYNPFTDHEKFLTKYCEIFIRLLI